MKKNEEQAFRSIEKQWNGGEHKLAGARASELVYGASTTMNEALFDELREKLPGIERYISAPASGKKLEPGRKARAKAASKGNSDDKGGAGSLVSTKLNPDPQNPEAA